MPVIIKYFLSFSKLFYEHRHNIVCSKVCLTKLLLSRSIPVVPEGISEAESLQGRAGLHYKKRPYFVHTEAFL